MTTGDTHVAPKDVPQLLRNIQGLTLLMLMLAVTAAAIGSLIKMMHGSQWLPIPELWKDVGDYLEFNSGSTALFSIFGLVITELWTRRGGYLRHPAVLIGFLAAVACVFVSALFTMLGAWGVASNHTEEVLELTRILHVIDVAGALSLLTTLLVTVHWRTMIMWPSWTWLMLGLVFLALLQLNTAIDPSNLLNSTGRLMVVGVPAMFGIIWSVWHKDQHEPSPIAGRGTWVGAILVLLGVPYLIVILYIHEELYVLQGMYYITIFAFHINLAALIIICTKKLIQGTGDRSINALILGGLVVLVMSLLPDYTPDWAGEHRSWLQRLQFLPNYGRPAMLLILLAGVLQFVRRHDPKGGPPWWSGYAWLSLVCLFLLIGWYATFQASYEIRIMKINNAQWNLHRTRAAHAVAALYLGSLILLAPASLRILRLFLRRKEQTPPTTGQLSN